MVEENAQKQSRWQREIPPDDRPLAIKSNVCRITYMHKEKPKKDTSGGRLDGKSAARSQAMLGILEAE